MKKIKTLSLNNPYYLIEKNNLIRLYCAWPLSRINSLIIPFSYPLYLAHIISKLYGLWSLSLGRYALLKAKTSNGDIFHIRDNNSQFHSIYFREFKDCYEPDVSAVLKIFLFEGATFIDIGSNWGHHSFIAASFMKANVVLFEPNPSVYADVLRITSDLGLEDLFQTHNLALSNNEGEITLTQNYFESGCASISGDFSNRINSVGKYERFLKNVLKIPSIQNKVKVKTLDFFELKRADLIKIDAEGVELEILEGAVGTISRLRPVIVFEFHSGDLTSYSDYVKFFDSVDYNLYIISCTRENVGQYQFQLFPATNESMKFNHQYNLLASPKEKYIEM